jgi:hypothetical protein
VWLRDRGAAEREGTRANAVYMRRPQDVNDACRPAPRARGVQAAEHRPSPSRLPPARPSWRRPVTTGGYSAAMTDSGARAVRHEHGGVDWDIPVDLLEIQRRFDAADAECARLAETVCGGEIMCSGADAEGGTRAASAGSGAAGALVGRRLPHPWATGLVTSPCVRFRRTRAQVGGGPARMPDNLSELHRDSRKQIKHWCLSHVDLFRSGPCRTM